ncbi:MAG: YARHG domain-containing protein [Acinetobacter sp.]|nr:MAG: YARHG domain-containing protein [Acinetobacter sp.]
MKNLILIILLFGLITSCQDKKKTAKGAVNNAAVKQETNQELYGVYAGKFDQKDDEDNADEYDDRMGFKLLLIIKRISGDTVYAQGKAFGETMALTGKMQKDGQHFSFTLGGDKDNTLGGEYIFKLLGSQITGDFVPFDKSETYRNRHFELTKKKFEYDASLMLVDDSTRYVDWSKAKNIKNIVKYDDGTIDTAENNFSRSASKDIFSVNASTKQLTEADVKNLRKLDLEIIRNTIFARHGYAFQKETFRSFFDPVDWYVPLYTNVDGKLTELEKANIKLLKRFEKYAEDNYDAFGR